MKERRKHEIQLHMQKEHSGYYDMRVVQKGQKPFLWLVQQI
jgi:hypothetical protein